MPEKEQIPDQDDINRSIFFPQHKNFDAASIFQFSRDKTDGSRRESVIWRKYAATMAEVHAIGCAIQDRMNHRRAENWKPQDVRYQGSIETRVQRVRGIRSDRGHSFNVNHEPDEGIHHAEVAVAAAEDTTLRSTDLQELRDRLFDLFGPLVAHACV